MQEEKKREVSFQIKRVKDISFFVNESLYLPESNKVIKIDINQTLGSNVEKKLINFILTIHLKYENAPANENLAGLEVQNLFEVLELPSLVNDNKNLELPFELLVLIMGTSISHARALLAKNLSGTVYQDTLMPLMNPVDVTKHFFPLPPGKNEIEFNQEQAGKLMPSIRG